MLSKRILSFKSLNVWAVEISFKPTTATISPALAVSISSLSSACILSNLPILCCLLIVELKTLSPAETFPE